MTSPQADKNSAGLSLVELLVVVAIIAVLSALVIPNISSIRGGTSEAVARQQQVELQTALGAWIAKNSSGPGGLAAARDAYNGAGDNKLGLVADYLQENTRANLSGGSSVKSTALIDSKATLQFSAWEPGSPPSVNWVGGQ